MQKALDAYKLEVAEANPGEEGAEAKMDVDEDAEDKKSKKEKKDKKKRKSLAADETVRVLIFVFETFRLPLLTRPLAISHYHRLRKLPRRSQRRTRRKSLQKLPKHQWRRQSEND